jgi:hypothetical protein
MRSAAKIVGYANPSKSGSVWRRLRMREKQLHVDDGDLQNIVLPLLLGRVFHVTPLRTVAGIRADGEIRSNVNGEFQSPFGSTNSFFRKRGYVSVFDYRSASPEQIEEALGKCSPFYVHTADPELLYEPNIAYLFLSDSVHDQLTPWTKWKDEEAYGDKVVPWVEAGYPGSVPIAAIEEILCVKIDYPTDSIAAQLHRALLRGRSKS